MILKAQPVWITVHILILIGKIVQIIAAMIQKDSKPPGMALTVARTL